jgi:hypothetical protein
MALLDREPDPLSTKFEGKKFFTLSNACLGMFCDILPTLNIYQLPPTHRYIFDYQRWNLKKRNKEM